MKKQKDEDNLEVSTLKQELETAKKMHEMRYTELDTQSKMVQSLLEKRLKEQEKLLENSKDKAEGLAEVTTLQQELEMAKKKHELRSLQLETEAKVVKSGLEEKLRQQEKLLEDSKGKIKELELNSKTINQSWIKKERIFETFLKIHQSGLEVCV